jgi:hypothetical protein
VPRKITCIRDPRRTIRRRRRWDRNPNFFSIQSRNKIWCHLLANNAKTRSNKRHDFYVEKLYGKNYGRQPAIFTMMREYAGNTMSPLALPCGLQDVYIW